MKFLIPIILLLAACSQPAPVARIAQTPSGYPGAVFSGISAQKLANKIAARCVERGNLLVSQSDNLVVCELPMSPPEIRWAKAFIGNPYASDIKTINQDHIVRIDGKLRVQTRLWTQLQMPYGRMKKHEINDAENFNLGIKRLYSMGGKPV